jgi:hypothetical protein
MIRFWFMNWVEQLQVGGPLAIVLGAAVAAIGRAYLAKDKQLAESQASRIADIKEILAKAGKDE